jgi:hypothetical protein
MLLNFIVFAIVVMAIIISYLIGTVSHPAEDLRLISSNRCLDNCYNNHCCGKICISPTELKVREEQAYSRGKYEAELKNCNRTNFEPKAMTMAKKYHDYT